MSDTKQPAKPSAAEEPELYDEEYGPYKKVEEAIKQREEFLNHKGFPMLSKSTLMEKKDGFYLTVTFRTRFPPSLPKPAVEEPLLDYIPGHDRKDEKD